MISLSPLSPEDVKVPHGIDFSNVLATGETITSVTSVVATPSTITAGTGAVADGIKPASAVQFTLGGGVMNQIYQLTAEIVTSNGVSLARSCYVPVENV